MFEWFDTLAAGSALPADAIDVAVCWRRDSLNPLVRNFLKCAEKVIRQA